MEQSNTKSKNRAYLEKPFLQVGVFPTVSDGQGIQPGSLDILAAKTSHLLSFTKLWQCSIAISAC